MSTASTDIEPSAEAQVAGFLRDTSLFLGPDPAIMEHHGLEPRTPFEAQCLEREDDPTRLETVRERLLAGVNESFEMLESMGAAPGAKWGDCVAAIFTASGDLSLASTGGVVIFCNLVQYPIKFINKYWAGDATVGIREGDVFIVNDARYGQAHNTDQSMMMPIFHEGRLIAWAGATVH
jgi:N-methylhydantoinase B/oxoprolinase/acetone carboxylase alpha subunit